VLEHRAVALVQRAGVSCWRFSHWRSGLKFLCCSLLLLLCLSAPASGDSDPWASAISVIAHDEIETHWKVTRWPSDESMQRMRHIDMAPENSGRRLKTRFEMLIRQDGTVAARVIQSSGVDAYDQAVLNAVEEYLYEPVNPQDSPPMYILPFEM
jgi:hypothetical protein